MADLIPFPRLFCRTQSGEVIKASPQAMADYVGRETARHWVRYPCANGMPSHPPCRSPAELEAMLRARADTTAAGEGV